MLRTAREADLETMLAWRNQRANREVSIHQHEIGLEEHRAWWGRVRDDASRRVLVFEYDGRALGVVTFFDLVLDREPRTGEWGFFLDHDTLAAEGVTMTAWIQVMKDATEHAFAPAPDGLGLEVLRGEVLEGNEAVRVMNRRFRFREGTAEQREVEGETLCVIPISLRREDRRRRRKETP